MFQPFEHQVQPKLAAEQLSYFDKRNSQPYIMSFFIGAYTPETSDQHDRAIRLSEVNVCPYFDLLVAARMCRLLNSLKVQPTLLSVQDFAW
jgi:hypothetical protein